MHSRITRHGGALGAFVIVGLIDARGHHAAAIRRFPEKELAGKRGVLLKRRLSGIRAHKNIRSDTAFLQKLGQHRVVAEGIHVITCAGNDLKLFHEIPLGVKQMPGEGFP